MMVLATTMIAIDTVAGRPAGGGSVSVGGAITVWRAAVEPAWAGPVATVVVLTSHGGAASASMGAQCIADVPSCTAVHDDALNPVVARSAIPGPSNAPPTNDARPDNESGVAAGTTAAQTDALSPRQEGDKCNESSADHGGARVLGGPSQTMESLAFVDARAIGVCALPVVAVTGRDDGGPGRNRKTHAVFVPKGSGAVAVHDTVAPMMVPRAEI